MDLAKEILKEANGCLKAAILELMQDIEEANDEELIEKARSIQDRLAVELFQK